MFVHELAIGTYSFKAVIKGIKDLHQEDLRAIKLSILLESINNNMERDVNRYNCVHCHKEGSVVLIDVAGKQFALACICSNGDVIQSIQSLVRWNGKNIQTSNGRILFRTQAARETGGDTPVDPASTVHNDSVIADLVASAGGTVVDEGERQ